MRDLVTVVLCLLQLCLAASAEYTLENVEAQIDSYNLQEQYWSQQQALTLSACRFTPASATDVSLAVLTLRVTSCQFAVKSGGHAAFAGASNIDAGLTIDLSGLNGITVSQDQSQTSIGAENLWYDVYTHLDPMNITVIGGRVAAIGVGGLTLGGGMSFFSGRYGWACDNVNSYEVVLADGSIRSVSYDSVYSDLYWALRGGGNNFGIVTSFDFATYPQGNLLRITNLSGLTVEFNNSNPGGYRQTYWTLTVGNSADLMADMVAIFMDEVEPLKDVVGIVPSIIFQPITTDMTTHFSKAGGNPLGLAGQGPLNLINVDISWSDPADDARVLAAAQNAVSRSAAAAKARGLTNPYLYQNYAALQQDVFASYGAANLARLKAIHAKYDPQNVWQTLQPGYFKLG
ncbi:FAD-binding domain containing protein [Grosmannia clavigera kw1407]|uniref:FAD-binding domain containing protein n=1 Tax=Grosmannia clavigera (strain kw1407 / UAMH 11150) TaxID=655863 RepID=F0XPG4_GROCL|nr:FAD-binding domain containing protein [Grosmannia clavigera kw1407]EFX00462.1 FAD-binding domain containing protein [Grosmannia clavigera kw1407]